MASEIPLSLQAPIFPSPAFVELLWPRWNHTLSVLSPIDLRLPCQCCHHGPPHDCLPPRTCCHGHGCWVRSPWISSSRRIIDTFTWKSVKRFLGCNHLVQLWTYNFHDLSETLSMDLKLWEQNNQHNQPRKLWIRCATSSRCWPRITDDIFCSRNVGLKITWMHPSNMHRGQPLAKTWCLIVVLLFGGQEFRPKVLEALIGFSRGQPEIIKKQLKIPPAPKHKAEHVRLASSQAILRSFAHSEPWPHAGTV